VEIGARLPFGGAKWDYQAVGEASPFWETGMTIAAVLQGKGSGVETISADDSLFDAVRRLGEKRIGALPVVEDGRIVGIVSERDVIYCLQTRGRAALELTVSDAMSSPAITVDSQTDVLAALALITERRIRHLPVVERGEIRGIVSIGDLVKYRMERIEAEADAMRAYIQSA
jgi:CBS domain-containing protein